MIHEKRRSELRAAISRFRWAAEGHSAACARGAPESERVQLYQATEVAAAKVEAAIAALEQPPDPPRGGAGWDALLRAWGDFDHVPGDTRAGYDAGRRDAAAMLRAESAATVAAMPIKGGANRWDRLADAIDGGAPVATLRVQPNGRAVGSWCGSYQITYTDGSIEHGDVSIDGVRTPRRMPPGST